MLQWATPPPTASPTPESPIARLITTWSPPLIRSAKAQTPTSRLQPKARFALAVECGRQRGRTVRGGRERFRRNDCRTPRLRSLDTSGVTNPAPQAVYQTERYGTFTYTFGGLTPVTSYKVRLHLAEYYWSAANARAFNVAITGTQVPATNYDIFAAAACGKNKRAHRARVHQNAPNGSGQIIVAFTVGSADQPKCSGIEILLPQTVTPVAGNNGPISGTGHGL